MFEKNLNISFLLDFYGDILGEKQRELVDLYYNADLSLSEIAESFGMTRQGVRHSLKKAEDVLIFLEKKLGLANQFVQIRENNSKIVDSLFSIYEKLKNCTIPNDITDLLYISTMEQHSALA